MSITYLDPADVDRDVFCTRCHRRLGDDGWCGVHGPEIEEVEAAEAVPVVKVEPKPDPNKLARARALGVRPRTNRT